MPEPLRNDGRTGLFKESAQPLLLAGGAWVLPVLGFCYWLFPGSTFARTMATIIAVLLAPLPALLFFVGQRRRLLSLTAKSEEEAAQLKLQLETVRFRTNRLREELQAADRQARLSPPTDAAWPIHRRFHARVQQPAGDCGGAD